MSYVGVSPAAGFTSLTKQVITGDGGASYTLDHAVANENEIEVFVNNVRQEPSVAYTVSNTALSMTGDVQASDDFYVVFQGKALQTVTPPSNSVTTDMIVDDAVTNAKIADDAVDTAQIADDAITGAQLASSVDMQNTTLKGGTNNALTINSSGRVSMPKTPAFHARKSSHTQNSGYLVFNSVNFNQGNHYDNTNGKFTAPEDGVYIFTFSTLLYSMNSASNVMLYVNGSNYYGMSSFGTYGQFTGTYAGQGATAVIYLNANDYVQLYFNHHGTHLHSNYTWWSGAKLA